MDVHKSVTYHSGKEDTGPGAGKIRLPIGRLTNACAASEGEFVFSQHPKAEVIADTPARG
jgi:hypothetical protein